MHVRLPTLTFVIVTTHSRRSRDSLWLSSPSLSVLIWPGCWPRPVKQMAGRSARSQNTAHTCKQLQEAQHRAKYNQQRNHPTSTATSIDANSDSRNRCRPSDIRQLHSPDSRPLVSPAGCMCVRVQHGRHGLLVLSYC